jgi:hypothetical protein
MARDALYCSSMMKAGHISFMMEATARVLLGALLFLVLASYLALPCMNRDTSQFQSFGAPNSCTEHHLFKPQADLSKLFTSINSELPFRLPLAIITFAILCLLAVLRGPVAHQKLKRRRRLRDSNLPFATEHPPKLSYFSALRSA